MCTDQPTNKQHARPLTALEIELIRRRRSKLSQIEPLKSSKEEGKPLQGLLGKVFRPLAMFFKKLVRKKGSVPNVERQDQTASANK